MFLFSSFYLISSCCQLQLQKSQYLQLGPNRGLYYGGSLPNVNQIGNATVEVTFQVRHHFSVIDFTAQEGVFNQIVFTWIILKITFTNIVTYLPSVFIISANWKGILQFQINIPQALMNAYPGKMSQGEARWEYSEKILVFIFRGNLDSNYTQHIKTISWAALVAQNSLTLCGPRAAGLPNPALVRE